MRDIIFSLFLIIVLAILQISFFSALSFPYNNIELFLPILVFIALTIDYKKSLKLGLFLALALELYSPLPFGLIVISLFFSLFIVNILFNNLFTNRSIYSLVSLTLVAIVTYNLILVAFTNLIYFFNLNINRLLITQIFLINLSWQLIFSLLSVTLLFYGYLIFKRF